MMATALDVRTDFPFLTRRFNGEPLIYFDSAATTQKPRRTIEAISQVYSSGIANVHRAVNFLSQEVTSQFEDGRQRIASFLGAQSREVIFTAGATHGLNLVCSSLRAAAPGRLRVLTTTLEHHSNLIPWTEHCDVEFVAWNPDGSIDMNDFRERLAAKPDLVTIARASNFLGTLHPVEEMCALARKAGAKVLVDASQSIAHERTDVRRIGCHFLVFSSHKVYGPGGLGVLFIHDELVDDFAPVLLGGSMVKEVHSTYFVPNDIPHRLEAGTPNIEGVIGLSAALDYVNSVGFDAIAHHEAELTGLAKQQLAAISGIELLGPQAGKHSAPIAVFRSKTLDSTAVAKALANRGNVIVRSGFHCAQPAHDELGSGPTVRASFGIYNHADEIAVMTGILKKLATVLD